MEVGGRRSSQSAVTHGGPSRRLGVRDDSLRAARSRTNPRSGAGSASSPESRNDRTSNSPTPTRAYELNRGVVVPYSLRDRGTSEAERARASVGTRTIFWGAPNYFRPLLAARRGSSTSYAFDTPRGMRAPPARWTEFLYPYTGAPNGYSRYYSESHVCTTHVRAFTFTSAGNAPQFRGRFFHMLLHTSITLKNTLHALKKILERFHQK